jgi:polyphenol oxidase
MIKSEDLKMQNVTHGFFTREGGFSNGIFSSLNCGLGSGDDIELVSKNREKVASDMMVPADHLVSAYQVHGTEVACVNAPFATRPKVDGLVTNRPGIALGILTADCGPILFADAKGRTVGACHAGWKGALHGVFRSTIVEMERLGSKRENIVAVLGPTISQQAYEVGPEFLAAFKERDKAFLKYFIPSIKHKHYMFDLTTFLVDLMRVFGIGNVVDLKLCTYGDEQRFFSYRRTTHRAENDYGRLISAIAMRE